MKRLFLLGLMICCGAVLAAAQSETIVDNIDPGCIVVGTWDTGTWTAYNDIYPWGVAGADKRYTTVTPAGDKTFTWVANLTAGDYEIYFCVNRGGYVNNAHYSIWSDGGATSIDVTASQYNTGGAVWLDLLATYGAKAYCNGETRVTVTNSSAGVTNGTIVIADAVRFYGPFASASSPTPTNTPVALPTVTPGIGSIYVESRSGGKNFASYAEVGGWADSTSKSTAEGLTAGIGCRYMSMAFPNRQAKFFLPTPQAPGRYEVSVSYPSGSVKGRWWVYTTGGLVGGDADTIDQTQNANTWISVGEYDLQPGFGYVQVGGIGDDIQTGNFLSDSARFVGPLATPTPTDTPEPTPTRSSGILGRDWSDYQ